MARWSRTDLAKERLVQLRLLSRLEKQLEKKLRVQLVKQVRKLAKDCAQGRSLTEHSLRKESDAIRKLLTRFYTQTAQVFGARVLDGLKANYTFLEAMTSWIDSRSLQLAVEITRTTTRRVRRILQASTEEGIGVEETARRIENAASDIARPRARTIARTELHQAAMEGSVQAAEATGLQMMKTWVSTEDDRTRSSHSAANGQSVPMDQPFNIGGELIMRPGEGNPENAINCRCVLVFDAT